MKTSIKKALLATTMSALMLAPAAAVVTIASADAAFAKSDKAKGKGPKKERAPKSRGKSAEKSNGKANAPGQLKKLEAAQEAVANQAANVTAVKSSPRPMTRGKSWKTRLDGEMLTTHPSELGAWNSAKRNPNAIANLVEKYRETGEANGAGGMIAALVVAYEDRNAAVTAAAADLQAAIDAGTITREQVEGILDGSLNMADLDTDLMTLKDGAGTEIGDYIVVDNPDGSISLACFEDADCDLTAAQMEADRIAAGYAALGTVIVPEQVLEDGTIIPAKTVGDISAEVESADALADAADATIVPNKSPDDATVVDMMIADVLNLLDLAREELELTDAPVEEVPEGEAI